MWSKEYFRLHRMDQYLFLGNLRFVQLQAIYTSVLVTFRHPDDGRLLFSLSISLHCDNLANVLVAMSTVGLLLMTCHAGRFYVFCNLLSWQFLVCFASSLLCLKPRVGLETKSKSSRIGIVFIARSEVWGAHVARCSCERLLLIGRIVVQLYASTIRLQTPISCNRSSIQTCHAVPKLRVHCHIAVWGSKFELCIFDNSASRFCQHSARVMPGDMK